MAQTITHFRRDGDVQPRLSILTPFYKESPALLLEALGRDSAMQGGDIEIILIDDGSRQPDLTEAVIACLEAQPYPASLITLSENEGRAAGRNHLMQAAQSKYFLFLDSDMLPDSQSFIQTWLDTIDHDRPDVVFGGFSLDQASDDQAYALHRAMASHSDTVGAEVRRQSPEKYIFTSNLLIRADILAEEGFDPAFTGWGWEDVEWSMRVSKRWTIGHIDNTATHLGLDTAETVAAKYEQSVANFARVIAAHRTIVAGYPSYKVAKFLSMTPLRRTWRPILKAVALTQSLPTKVRAFSMRLYRAALYAEVV